MKQTIQIFFLTLFTITLSAQSNIEEELGAWYMYFWQVDLDNSKIGFQGDVQYRHWNIIGDMEQLLLRGGATYELTDNTLGTIGYANITTGEFGDSDETINENRIYQEILISHSVSKYVKLRHRYRYEQRWVDDQDLRTRYRYNLFLTIPLKDKFYLSFYNELFINGQRDIGQGREVRLFDRNRFYGALGMKLSNKHNVQLGLMNQKTNNVSKAQLQFSLHSKF